MVLLVPISAAICLLGRPETTSGSTSRSRGVSHSKRSRRGQQFPPRVGVWPGRAPALCELHPADSDRGMAWSGTRQLPPSLPGPHWNVAMPGNKDDRNGNLGLGQLALEIEPANFWQSDIEDHATWHIRSFALQKLLRPSRRAQPVNQPSGRIRLLSELRTDASSSTTNTMDWGSVMRYCPPSGDPRIRRLLRTKLRP